MKWASFQIKEKYTFFLFLFVSFRWYLGVIRIMLQVKMTEIVELEPSIYKCFITHCLVTQENVAYTIY